MHTFLKKRYKYLSRKIHSYGAILIAIPFLLVLSTGIILLLKKETTWIQPASMKGEGKRPELSFDKILQSAAAAPKANIRQWSDIDRLDVRPSKGIIKIRGKNRWEIQIDSISGNVLQVAYRRSDLIESLHDGTWFHDSLKLSVILPMSIILLALWITGLYMFLIPSMTRYSKRKIEARAIVKEKTQSVVHGSVSTRS